MNWNQGDTVTVIEHSQYQFATGTIEEISVDSELSEQRKMVSVQILLENGERITRSIEENRLIEILMR